MRHVWPCAVLCVLSTAAGQERSNQSPDQSSEPILTVVLEFRGPHATRAVEEMEREAERILRGAGRAMEWRSWDEATHGVFDDLAVVRFNGNCGAPRWHHYGPIEGPLGFTYISNGTVLPFSEIACEKIADSVGPAIEKMGPEQAEAVFGRAMGRVVAHELVHMMTRSAVHGHEGIAQSALSPNELTCDRLDLSPADLARVSAKESR
jgi:hypothetical protein